MKTPISSLLVKGDGRNLRRETGIVTSKFSYLEGRREESADTMRAGRVAVIVVPLRRQARMKAAVVEAGMTRERKLDWRGSEIEAPDQRLLRFGAGVDGWVVWGWRASRLGNIVLSTNGIVVFRRGLELVERAMRKCL